MIDCFGCKHRETISTDRGDKHECGLHPEERCPYEDK